MTERWVAAPGLAEVAAAWWDREIEPAVAWDATGRRFELVDPTGSDVLPIVTLAGPAGDPEVVARALAAGLAGCDFPPTADAASPRAVAATLRAAGIDVPTG